MWQIARHVGSKATLCENYPAVPLKTMMRLRWYIAALDSFGAQEIVSSRELADSVGIGPAMVRKDLSHVGELGTPGLGYHVADLKERIHAILDQHTCTLAWIGAQWLNDAISTFAPTLDLNFRIVAAFDTRPEWIGKTVGEWEVRPLADLEPLLSAGSIDGVVLALPEHAASVAVRLISAGVKGILNLTPVSLTAPASVSMRHVDLIGEMMALAMAVSDTREDAGPTCRGGARTANAGVAQERYSPLLTGTERTAEHPERKH